MFLCVFIPANFYKFFVIVLKFQCMFRGYVRNCFQLFSILIKKISSLSSKEGYNWNNKNIFAIFDFFWNWKQKELLKEREIAHLAGATAHYLCIYSLIFPPSPLTAYHAQGPIKPMWGPSPDASLMLPSPLENSLKLTISKNLKYRYLGINFIFLVDFISKTSMLSNWAFEGKK